MSLRKEGRKHCNKIARSIEKGLGGKAKLPKFQIARKELGDRNRNGTAEVILLIVVDNTLPFLF